MEAKAHSPSEPHTAVSDLLSLPWAPLSNFQCRTYSSGDDFQDKTLGILELHSSLFSLCRENFWGLQHTNKCIWTVSLLMLKQFYYHCTRNQELSEIKFNSTAGVLALWLEMRKLYQVLLISKGPCNKSRQIWWANTTKCCDFRAHVSEGQNKEKWWNVFKGQSRKRAYPPSVLFPAKLFYKQRQSNHLEESRKSIIYSKLVL